MTHRNKCWESGYVINTKNQSQQDFHAWLTQEQKVNDNWHKGNWDCNVKQNANSKQQNEMWNGRVKT